MKHLVRGFETKGESMAHNKVINKFLLEPPQNQTLPFSPVENHDQFLLHQRRLPLFG